MEEKFGSSNASSSTSGMSTRSQKSKERPMEQNETDVNAKGQSKPSQHQQEEQHAMDWQMLKQPGSVNPAGGQVQNTAGKMALQQLMQTLRSPNTPEQQNQILHILKSNPPLMAAFMKQRQEVNESSPPKVAKQDFIPMEDEQHDEVVTKKEKFVVKNLRVTKLGTYIETLVNSFLKEKEVGAGEVFIRVISSINKKVVVKPGMKSRFADNGDMTSVFPYREKTLLAFEKIDGTDVCFFVMRVQEYGSECTPPNTRRVNISHLGSTSFFEPKELTAAVGHEILLGYLDYAKQLGYVMAHIWMRPPMPNADYMFQNEADNQKIPNSKRLQEWCMEMLEKGIVKRIIVDYKDILKKALEDKLSSVMDLPYFEGDFWPNVFEESIKQLSKEEEGNRKQDEATEVAGATATAANSDLETGLNDEKKTQKETKEFNKSKASQTKNTPQTENDLLAKIFAVMENHKEEFFVVQLHTAQSAASLATIQDPDPVFDFDSTSLKHAATSFLSMVYKLHDQEADIFGHYCNKCYTHVETWYHCTVCGDVDLCPTCKETEGHSHEMEKIGLDMDDGSSRTDANQADSQKVRKFSIQRCIQSLVHACQCKDADCRLSSCQRMKRVVQHIKTCKIRTSGGCPICKQLVALCCHHARHCQEAKCPVPFCFNIKQKLKQEQQYRQLQKARLLKRKMDWMNTRPTESLKVAPYSAWTQAFQLKSPAPTLPTDKAAQAQQLLLKKSNEILGTSYTHSKVNTDIQDSTAQNTDVEMSAAQEESQLTECEKLLETLSKNISQLGNVNQLQLDEVKNLIQAANDKVNAMLLLN